LWRFKEGTGVSVADDSRNGNTGTLFSGYAWSSGKLGYGLLVNSTNKYLTVTNSPSIDLTGNMTVSAWVKPNSLNTFATVLMKAYYSSWNDGYGLANLNGGTNEISFYVGQWSGGATGYIPLNQWSHLAGTFDNVTVKLFVNGQLNASRAYSQPITSYGGNLQIGAGAGNPRSYPWDGLIDEVAIWNRPLSVREIQQVYDCGQH
jgi:hypothetical protein